MPTSTKGSNLVAQKERVGLKNIFTIDEYTVIQWLYEYNILLPFAYSEFAKHMQNLH